MMGGLAGPGEQSQPHLPGQESGRRTHRRRGLLLPCRHASAAAPENARESLLLCQLRLASPRGGNATLLEEVDVCCGGRGDA